MTRGARALGIGGPMNVEMKRGIWRRMRRRKNRSNAWTRTMMLALPPMGHHQHYILRVRSRRNVILGKEETHMGGPFNECCVPKLSSQDDATSHVHQCRFPSSGSELGRSHGHKS